jgi:hypothetical protein
MDLEGLESDFNIYGTKELLQSNGFNVDLIYTGCTEDKSILDGLLISYATTGYEYLHSDLIDGKYKAQIKYT